MPRQRGFSRQARRSSSAEGSARARVVMVLSLMGRYLRVVFRSLEKLVGRERQELIEGFRLDHLLEEPCGRREDALAQARGAYLGVDAVELGVDQPAEARLGHRLAVAGARAVPQPLPQLRAADLGGGGVLHEVVEPNADVTAQR